MHHRFVSAIIIGGAIGIAALCMGATHVGRAQTPAANTGGAALLSEQHPARLFQLMRGIMLPNSNILFYAEDNDPAKIPPAKNAPGAINPLEGSFGQWDAVENSTLAIAEAASLLTVPGRLCSNGQPVPVDHADWPKKVNDLRVAAIKALSCRAGQESG